MGKSLVDKLRNVGKGVRNLALLGAAVASIGFAGCKLSTPDSVNYAPKAVLQVANTSSNNYDIHLTGEDQNGNADITGYQVSIDLGGDGTIDEKIPQTGLSNSPIDIQRQFNSNTKVYGTVTDSQGKTNETEKVISPGAPDYLDVTGQVINDKTRIGQKAKVKIENSANETIPIETIDTDNNGNFVYHSKTKVSDISGVTLKAVLVDSSGNPISYANTMRYPAGDVTGAVVEPYPYPNFASASDYKQHYLITNVYSGLTSGNKRWDLEGKVASENALKGIIIFQTNPHPSNGSFSAGLGSQRQILENKIVSSDDIEVYLKGSNFNSGQLDGLIKDSSLGVGYQIDSNGIIQPYPGYILVIPDKNLPNPNLLNQELGETSVGYYQSISTGIINSAIIRINPNIVDGDLFNRVVSHEFKHALNSPYDLILPYNEHTLGGITNPPSPDLTILRYDTHLTKPGIADEEDAYVSNGNPPAEKADDFLGDW